MASVKIILKESKIKADGTSPLYLQLIHNKKSTEVSLKKSIPSKHWNKEKQKIRSSYPNYSPLNIAIHNEKRRYEKIIADKLARMESFSAKDIVAIGKGKQTLEKERGSFTEYLKNFIAKNPNNLSYNTLKNYKSTQSRLSSFQGNITYGDLDRKWILKFEKFLKESGNRVNTIHSHMKVVKKMVGICLQNNLMDKNPFSGYKLKTEEGDRDYLNKEELKGLAALTGLAKTYELVRDVFLFSCYTGLRYGDIVTLSKDSIRKEKDNDGKIIYKLFIKMQKTNELLTLKLSKVPISLIKKYGHQANNNLIFPVLKPTINLENDKELKDEISRKNAYHNKVIKLLCEKAAIDKKISMHCGRHTFATLSLDLGIPLVTVSKLLGHKNIRETQIYAKILDRNKDAAIDMWNKI
ncbi:MAG: site-specific integrase [Saprospiraceae bacterium]|nr:site-specific integrase [Saprospiraceae bacterium]